MVWQVKHCCMKIALPFSTLASLSLGPIGGSSAGCAPAAASGARLGHGDRRLLQLVRITSAFDTLPTTIANSAEARKQPAIVLKLAIVRSRPANFFGRCCSTPAARSVVSDRAPRASRGGTSQVPDFARFFGFCRAD